MKVLKDLEELDSEDDNSELDDSLRLKRTEVVNQLRVINKNIRFDFAPKGQGQLVKGRWSKYYYSIIKWRRLRNGVLQHVQKTSKQER